MTHWKHICGSAFHRGLLFALVLLATTLPAAAQATTRPATTLPVAVWFQPARNVAMLRALGVDTFVGPEVENAGAMSPDALAAARAAWVKVVADAGGRVILKGHAGP